MSNLVESNGNDVSTEVVESSLGLTAQDVMIPKVLLMQKMSQLVENEDNDIKEGDFVHSLSEEIIGDKNKPLSVVVIGMFKTVIISENGEYARTESWTPELAKLPYEETVDGVTVNRSTALNYYVLLKKDIAEMEAFPHVITFKRTGVKAGKTLGTHLLMLEDFGKKPYFKNFILGAKKEKGDKGSYYVWDIKKGETSSEEEQAIAKRWTERLTTMKVNIHDDEDTGRTKEAVVVDVENTPY